MKSGSVSQRKFKDVMMMAMKKEEESTGWGVKVAFTRKIRERDHVLESPEGNISDTLT
jgi:hypothetical protein